MKPIFAKKTIYMFLVFNLTSWKRRGMTLCNSIGYVCVSLIDDKPITYHIQIQ